MSNILDGNITANGLGFVKATIDGILFNKIKTSNQSITTPNPVMPLSNKDLWKKNVESLDGIKGINVVDIDWNEAQPEENIVIRSTADLFNWIKSLSMQGEPGKSAYDIYVEENGVGFKEVEVLTNTKPDGTEDESTASFVGRTLLIPADAEIGALYLLYDFNKQEIGVSVKLTEVNGNIYSFETSIIHIYLRLINQISH